MGCSTMYISIVAQLGTLLLYKYHIGCICKRSCKTEYSYAASYVA